MQRIETNLVKSMLTLHAIFRLTYNGTLIYIFNIAMLCFDALPTIVNTDILWKDKIDRSLIC